MTALGLSPPITLLNVPNTITAVRTGGAPGYRRADRRRRSDRRQDPDLPRHPRRVPLTLAATPAHQAHSDRADTSGPVGGGPRAPEGGRRTTRGGAGTPHQTTGVLLVSAVTGFPPLLAASVYLARTPLRPVAFAATCPLGRTIRFVAIALTPRLVGY
ncbi:hypothetical protein GA0070623_1465 [Micromonospora rifamycinica]|uniref:Uncharacterized protein n=1 Tax=Micromonospora rifamycinica TaxID=291594 RepID=A0A1C5HMZ8_9ACTN|nr:hypothetical protein GA0070623_1465 [Micromonospora rifamycinica]